MCRRALTATKPLLSVLFAKMDGILTSAVLIAATLTVSVSCDRVCVIGSECTPQSGTPPRWFLPYKDPCECTAVRLGGMCIPPSSHHQRRAYYMDHLFLSEVLEEIQATFKCAGACSGRDSLGLEDGSIPDERMTSSGHISTYVASQGRLNSQGSWATHSSSSPGSWIQVDLLDPTLVSGVVTQGSPTSTRCVTTYRVSYKPPLSSVWKLVQDEDGHTGVFDGNTSEDPRIPVTSFFSPTITATKVRIQPQAWSGFVVLRFELLGCHLD